MIPKQQNRKIIKCRFFNNFFLVCFRDVYILICMNGCLGWIVQKTLSSLSSFWRGRECTVPVVENGSWGKVSKKAAEVWWCSRWLCQPCLLPCLYNPHSLGAFQRAAAQLHPGEMLQVSPPHFLEVLGWNTHLEDVEHQKKVGGLWKVIQDPVRTPVCNVRLQTKINADYLTSSELLSFEEVNSLNCCMCVWVNMVQLLICCSIFDYV